MRRVRNSELNPWWRVGVAVSAIIQTVLVRVRVEGIEQVPRSGPAILAFDHVSVLDGPVLAIEIGRRLRRETRFLVASENFSLRVVGWILRRYDQIPIRRGHGDVGALDEAIRTVNAGALAAIAPEGRVNERPDGGLLRIRHGTARIALPTGAPVIPVGVWGTQARWPHAGFSWGRPLRPTVGLVFGRPILPTGDATDPSDIEAFTDRVRSGLEEQIARARTLAS